MEINKDEAKLLLSALESKLDIILPPCQKRLISPLAAKHLKLFKRLCDAIDCPEHYDVFLSWRDLTDNDVKNELKKYEKEKKL